MQDLRIGVIGAAGRGFLAARAHHPEEGSRVVAVCDTRQEALDKAIERYGEEVQTLTDYRELLALDLDAVFVTTPDFLHEEMAVAALEAGVAVYLEKPMAITTEGCDRILRTAYETKTRLYLGHNMRHMPFVIKMKELIDAGAIGNVKAIWCRHFVGHGGDYYFKDWHAERRYSNGLLLQKGAHDIDVLHWLAGSYASKVSAFGKLAVYGEVEDRVKPTKGPRTRGPIIDKEFYWPPSTQKGMNAHIDVEDLSQMNMELQNGILASYQQCHFSPDYWRNYCVIGDEGRMENFGNGEDGTQIQVWNKRKWGYNAPDQVHMIERPEGGHGGADPRIVAEFLRFVREGGVTQTSPLAGRYSVAAGCAATDSIRDGGTLQQVPAVPANLTRYFGELAQSIPGEERTAISHNNGYAKNGVK